MKSKLLERTLLPLVTVNENMSLYLDNLNRGRLATPHSWLYEKEDSKTTLQRWLPLMESANNKTKFGEMFNQFDRKQIDKFGPQGEVPPIASKECQEVIEPIFQPSKYNDPNALSQYFEDTEIFADQAFGRFKLRQRPKSFESVVDDMSARDTLSTNSGFPRFVRRSTVLQDEIQDATSGKAYEFPAIILFRQYNGKLRPVWMFPMSVNLIEFSFSQVVQDALLRSVPDIQAYLSPWLGYEDVKQTLTEQWDGGTIVGGDTTKMDANMRPAQIQLVYEIVKWLFQKQYWEQLHQSLMHICDIELLYSRTRTYSGVHGLASGSGWTQLTETVLQLFMAWRRKVDGQGIGDDFYWLEDMTADELVDYLGSFGLPANPTKQTVSEDHLTFLQRLHHRDFFSRESNKVLGAYYPTVRALNSMLHPEKFHKPKDWSSDMFCIRNYMILENCVDNPCFDEFLKFVVCGQKDMIPFAKKQFSELNAAQTSARLIPGLNPSYNQEKRDKPLWSFVSIRLAKLL